MRNARDVQEALGDSAHGKSSERELRRQENEEKGLHDRMTFFEPEDNG